MPAHHAMPLVRAGARKALEIDPLLSDAHAMLGIVGVYDYDWKEAERLFRLAMARDPVPPQVHAWYGWFFLMVMSRPEAAVEEFERGLQEDPLHLLFRVLLAFCMEAAARYEDASTELRRILELDENYWVAYTMLVWNHALRGMFPEALPLAARA
jgi:Tfp pilus assembly protein PilF